MDRLRLDVQDAPRASAGAPAVLLLNDRFDSNWKVAVDAKPAAMLRCNFIMRGVHLAPGEHTVTFRFEPDHTMFFVTLGAVVFGLLLCGFLAISRAPDTRLWRLFPRDRLPQQKRFETYLEIDLADLLERFIKPGRSVAFGVENAVVGSLDLVVVAEHAEDGLNLPEIKRHIKDTLFQEIGIAIREAMVVPSGWLVKTTSGKISRESNKAKYLSEKSRQSTLSVETRPA